MPQNLHSSSFTKNLLSKLEKIEPKNRNYFLFRNLGFGLLIFFLLILSVYLLAIFWVDTFELFSFLESGNNLNWDLLSQGLFEFATLATILVVLVYIIYRQTDWFLVRHKIILLGSFLLTVFVASILLIVITQGQNQIALPTEHLSYRPNRQQKIQEKLQENKVFVGKIIKIDRQNQEIVVKSPQQEKIFKFEQLPSKIKPNQQVAIKYEIDVNKNFTLQKIRILPKKPMRNR